MTRRSRKNIKAIYKKQLQLYLKTFLWANAIVFTVMTVIFELFVLEDYEAGVMVATFGTMTITMGIMQTALGLTTQDKMSKSFKYMTMAGVKPLEYLIGTLSALGVGAIVSVTIFSLNAFLVGQNFFLLLGVLLFGALISIFFGTTAGLMKQAGWGTLISMLLGFSIFFSGINDTIDDILFWLYPRQIDLIIRRYVLANPEAMYPEEIRIVDVPLGFRIILLNFAVILIIFLWSNRKNRLKT